MGYQNMYNDPSWSAIGQHGAKLHSDYIANHVTKILRIPTTE